MKIIASLSCLLICLLGLFSCCAESSTSETTYEELFAISAYLKANGSPRENPAHDLELIIDNKNQLPGPIAHSLYRMVKELACDEGKSIDEIGSVSNRLGDQRLRQMLSYAGEQYLNRCRRKIQDELGQALAQIGHQERNRLSELLTESFIRTFSDSNPDIVEGVDKLGELGAMFNRSLPLLVKHIQSNFHGIQFNPKKKLHMIKGAKMITESLANSCPDYYRYSQQLVATLRHLMKMIGDEEKAKLDNFSKDFQENLFRYKYCEDLMTMKGPQSIRGKVEHALQQASV